MRSSSLAAGTAVFAMAVLGAVPAMASSPVADSTGTPMCGTSQLSAALGGGDAGAGNLYRYLVITNTSSTTCHLTGYPGLSMLDANGQQIGQPATREPRTYSPVVLKPGASASDTIHTANHQGTCLQPSSKLKIYPPGNTASLTIPGAITECFNTFSVTPMGPGKGGNDGGTPTTSPTSAPSTGANGGAQVPTVPSGAPDTGLAATGSHGSDSTALAATGAGALVLGAAGFAVARRRRVRDGR
ncbi:Protein of unknown function [Actinacidiphila yanglinensis]|uniref:DUF4232 domain-containing protein n=1 Tax=Actinacidiphila yanglinensis TaxID=310779 RepID=A0A1H6C9K4_9ACTN|nr:DUF4232 domain-containing protein [Actinacidiphila yanglinensis]SEG69650.1 Protein of unknown function [Actinacidiphila yanglinensis]